MEPQPLEVFEPVNRRLTADLKAAARQMGRESARYMVASYYKHQEDRIRTAAQVRELGDEPSDCLVFLMDQHSGLEHLAKSMLDAWGKAQPLGVWARSHKGIGPVIAAGMLAHIDLDKAPVAASVFRFAGLDPTVKWEKKTKRPWNADLKRLCWLAGESFVKVSGLDGATYGHLYAKRKALEIQRNEAGDFADQAAAALESSRAPGPKTEAFGHYTAGRLPPARIHLRATRYAVKLFLSHYHEVGHRLAGKEPPAPWVIAHGGHAHYIPPPNLDVVGMEPYTSVQVHDLVEGDDGAPRSR